MNKTGSARALHCQACASRVQSVFCNLSPDQTQALDACKSDHLYGKGQILFYEGNPALGVYCLSSGRIKLYRAGSGGRQQIMGIAQAGSVLGYRALFSDAPLSLTAEVMEEARVCFIEKKSFLSLVARNSGTAMTLLKKISQDLTAAEDQLMDLVDKPVPVRMARLLLVLKETYGKAAGPGVRLDIQLRRADLADMIGTSPETAMRVLSDFKKRAFLRLDGRDITLLNLDALLRIGRLVQERLPEVP